MDINIDFIINNIIKNLDLYLKNTDISYEIITFNNYLEKTKIFTIPDIFFENIGKILIKEIQNYAEEIYNIRFIQKNHIIEETNLSFSFECMYINIREIKFIKNIIHIFQFDKENCILKIIPLCNITSKSIFINIKKNREIDNITNELNRLNLKIQCNYFPKSGKNKGIRCINESNNESIDTKNTYCNKHKRFTNYNN